MKDNNSGIPNLPDNILDAIPRKKLDIAYCDQSPSQKLDIYWSEKGDGPYPVIVYFHAGAFMMGGRRDKNLEPMLRALKRGYALVSVEYRLSHEVRFPALIHDAKSAIRFIRANAEEYKFNPNKIAAWGQSAGGYIAAMLGLIHDNPAFEDLSQGNADQSSAVQAVVDWFGPCGDFCLMDNDIHDNGIGIMDHNEPDSPESLLMGAQITTIPELCRMAAPYIYANSDIPPFLIMHAEVDPVVPPQQSERLAKALIKAAGKEKVIFELCKGINHDGDTWNETLTSRVFDFIDEKFK